MKRRWYLAALALLVCAVIFIQMLGAGGLGVVANAAEGAFEDSFDYDDFDDMTQSGLWALESAERTDATEPTLDDGVMKLVTKNSVQFKWTQVNGVGSYSTDKAYVFDFDVKVTDSGNGNLWTGADHTRILYVAFGGWYNQIEINNKDAKVKVGDTPIDYSEDTFMNKTVHVNITLQGDTVSSIITDESGKIIVAGDRTNSAYTDMNERNGAMTYLVLRCEDGAAEIDNFKFQSKDAEEIVPERTVYTCTLTHTERGTALLKLDGSEIFSLSSGTLRVCNAQVLGDYGVGEYGIKVIVNPLQKLMYVDVTLADGGTLRRGYAYSRNVPTFEWRVRNSDAVSNENTVTESVEKNDYELVTVEPVVAGFGSNVYNLVTSFDDAKTTRLLAWTAKHSFITSRDMAVKYRKKGDSEWTQIDARKLSETIPSEDYFKVDITGLTAGTEYEYKIGVKGSDDANDWSDVYTFKTAENNVESFKFVAVGDTQSVSWGGLNLDNKGYTYTYAALTEAIKEAGDAAFILNAGDVTDIGSNLNMWNWYFKALGDYAAEIPHFATIGNHDTWVTDSNNYFGLHFNHPDNGSDALDKDITSSITDGSLKNLVNSPEDTIYSYDYGEAHFIVLNSGSYSGDDRYIIEAQRDWLINDLEENSDAKWTIVMVHEPVYHRKGGSEDRPWLYDVIEGYGVDLVIQGHSHLVTRTYPMKDGQIVTKTSPDVIKQGTGTVYTTIGSTTLNHDSLGDPNVEECMLVVTPENEQATYTVVSVESDKLVMTVRQLNGLVVDEFTILANSDGGNNGGDNNNDNNNGNNNGNVNDGENKPTETEPSTNAPSTEAPTATTPVEEKKGCGSVIGSGIVAVCTTLGLGVAVTCKKRKERE